MTDLHILYIQFFFFNLKQFPLFLICSMLQLLSTNIDLVKKTIFNKVYFLCFSFFLLSFIQKDLYPVNCREKSKSIKQQSFPKCQQAFFMAHKEHNLAHNWANRGIL